MRIVDPEDPDSVSHPKPQHVEQRLHQVGLVGGVEVDRINILVFFGRVLGVFNRAVGAMFEPIRMLLHPGMVGRALNREVQGDLVPDSARHPHEMVKVGQAFPVRAPPPCSRPPRFQSPTGCQRCHCRHREYCWVPCDGSLRSDGWAEGRPRRSPYPALRAAAARRFECSGLVGLAPLGTYEHLVPGAEACPRPVDDQFG